MRVLLVHAHPRSDSFSTALRDTTAKALRAAGHEVEIRDLYHEGFRPALSALERAAYHDTPGNLRGIEDHVTSLRSAEALVLVYPTWWYGMPAMLKGWFDRVWAPGVAFHMSEGAITPGMRHIKRLAVVTTYGSPGWLLWYIGHPDRKLIGRGIRRLCARRARLDWLSLTRMDSRKPPELQSFLAKVEAHFRRW